MNWIWYFISCIIFKTPCHSKSPFFCLSIRYNIFNPVAVFPFFLNSIFSFQWMKAKFVNIFQHFFYRACLWCWHNIGRHIYLYIEILYRGVQSIYSKTCVAAEKFQSYGNRFHMKKVVVLPVFVFYMKADRRNRYIWDIFFYFEIGIDLIFCSVTALSTN